jgi:hypothetical protein
MSTSRSWLLALALVGALAGCATEPPRPDPLEVVSPRIGRVVDADTGQPIEGAIVLNAFYLWPQRGFGNFPTAKVFRNAMEGVTDADGAFHLSGPFDSLTWWTDEVFVFKPAYGPWRFRDAQDPPPTTPDPRVVWAWRQRMWEKLTTTGAVIELRPLRTREERLKYIDHGWAPGDRLEREFSRGTPFTPSFFFDIPADRLLRIQRAIDDERASLGLPPRRLAGRSPA